MPSGYAQRTWYLEMIVRLWSQWHREMSALISLRSKLIRQQIRIGRNIQTPIVTCRRCGTTRLVTNPTLGCVL
jgi:hypothetical protein